MTRWWEIHLSVQYRATEAATTQNMNRHMRGLALLAIIILIVLLYRRFTDDIER